MTISEQVGKAMSNVLDKIRRDFYQDRMREFMRDHRSLMKAIATYGHECNQRGWSFEVEFIYHELMQLLLKIRIQEADIKYLPIYLEGAIRRHLGQLAEELSAKAKALAPKISTIIDKLKPVEAIRQPSAVEVFTEVYRGIGKINRARKGKQTVKAKQEELL